MAAPVFTLGRGRRRWAHQNLLHDAVTGLLTTAALIDRLDATLTRARRHGTTTGLLLVSVNASQARTGWPAGNSDQVAFLDVAQRLRTLIRNEDSIARTASNELAVLLTDVNDQRVPARIAERLLEICQPLAASQQPAPALSVGIATTPLGAASPAGMLAEARVALAAAEHAGRNRFQLFDTDTHQRVRDLLQLEDDLSHAIDRAQLVVYYQPEIDLRTGAIIGIEALLRWRHPSRGFIPPDQFIPLAEDCGLIAALGTWTLRHACNMLRRLRQDLPGLEQLRLNVNVSPRQLTRTFVDDLTRVCHDTGIDPHQLVLEITETTLIDDIPTAAPVLRDIRRLGVQLAIDDFGIGYSALSYLRDLPIAVIKLDKYFIGHLHETTSSAIVRAVMQLADDLGLSVTAEGVETVQQHHDLQRLGCTRAQGYLFARPIPEQQLRELLQRRQGPHTAAAPDEPTQRDTPTPTCPHAPG